MLIYEYLILSWSSPLHIFIYRVLITFIFSDCSIQSALTWTLTLSHSEYHRPIRQGTQMASLPAECRHFLPQPEPHGEAILPHRAEDQSQRQRVNKHWTQIFPNISELHETVFLTAQIHKPDGDQQGGVAGERREERPAHYSWSESKTEKVQAIQTKPQPPSALVSRQTTSWAAEPPFITSQRT